MMKKRETPWALALFGGMLIFTLPARGQEASATRDAVMEEFTVSEPVDV